MPENKIQTGNRKHRIKTYVKQVAMKDATIFVKYDKNKNLSKKISIM